MLSYLRYALATFCVAASIGCLASWGWSLTHQDDYFYDISSESCLVFESCCGNAGVTWLSGDGLIPHKANWTVKSWPISEERWRIEERHIKEDGLFASGTNWVRIPLWFPAIAFALAGVAALRLGRRFTIRSAIIAMTIVAGLLGMAVIL